MRTFDFLNFAQVDSVLSADGRRPVRQSKYTHDCQPTRGSSRSNTKRTVKRLSASSDHRVSFESLVQLLHQRNHVVAIVRTCGFLADHAKGDE